MSRHIDRRAFLKASSAILAAASVGGLVGSRGAFAAAIDAPLVDKLSIRVLVDSSFDLFFRPTQLNSVTVQPLPRLADFRRTLHNEWGLSLWLESQRVGDQRTLMLDYG